MTPLLQRVDDVFAPGPLRGRRRRPRWVSVATILASSILHNAATVPAEERSGTAHCDRAPGRAAQMRRSRTALRNMVIWISLHGAGILPFKGRPRIAAADVTLALADRSPPRVTRAVASASAPP